MSDVPFKNPGWAGNTGEFSLTERDVRGDDFVGVRPKAGAHPATAATYPYMLAESRPDAPLFEGPYKVRFEKILSRYPDKRAALLPSLNLKLLPKLKAELKPGTRVVSHAFDMGDQWKPEQTLDVDGRQVYFWTIPRR